MLEMAERALRLSPRYVPALLQRAFARADTGEHAARVLEKSDRKSVV